MGNMIGKTFITLMILATFVLPQHALGQWDVDVDEPASGLTAQDQQQGDNSESLGGITPNKVEGQTKIIKQSNTRELLDSKSYNGIVAGTLSNKINPASILSYAKGGGRGSILCSTIARINLNILTGLPYRQGGFGDDSIARGDAYALALHGASRGQMIVTSKTSMESDIHVQYDKKYSPMGLILCINT